MNKNIEKAALKLAKAYAAWIYANAEYNSLVQELANKPAPWTWTMGTVKVKMPRMMGVSGARPYRPRAGER